MVGRLTDTPWSDDDPQTRAVMLSGRYRLPSDVVSELMDHLARADARIVVCDLTGMAASREMDGMFEPVASYLAAWPGTLVVVCVPEASEHSRMVPAAIADRLLVHRSIEPGLREARALMPVMEQTQTLLPPMPAAVSGARDLVSSTLRDWQLTDLAWPAGLVTSELVTNAIRHSATVLNLSLSRVDTRLRIAVHDRGGGQPAIPTRSEREAATEPNGRGLQLIDAESHAWGVFPSRGHGKTVWALLDVAQESPEASRTRARAQRSASRERVARALMREIAAHRRAVEVHENAVARFTELGQLERAEAARTRLQHARKLLHQALQQQGKQPS